MRTVFKGKIFKVVQKKVGFRDGHSATFDLVYHLPAVAIVAYLREQDSILMVRQPRFAVGKRLWEIPAGLVDRGERPALAARRELEEETGYKAGRMIKLKTIFSSPGFTDETTHLYMATGLIRTRTRHETDEEIQVRSFKLSSLPAEFSGSGACDAKSALAIFLALKKLKREIP